MCELVAACQPCCPPAPPVRLLFSIRISSAPDPSHSIRDGRTNGTTLHIFSSSHLHLALTPAASVSLALALQAHAHIPTIAPICIGLAVTGAHFVAIPVDNCSINPARSFGASIPAFKV